MKYSLLLLGLTFATAASAAEPRINMCPGASVRVLSVGAVGAQRAGGAHGTRELWTQAFFDPRNRWIPFHDIRADLEAELRGFDVSRHAFPAFREEIVPPEAVLAELFGIRDTAVTACVSRLDVESLTENRANGAAELDIGIGLKVYASLDTDSGRQSILVQELAGRQHVTSPFREVYINYALQKAPFLDDAWAGLQKNLTLSPAPSAEADQGLSRFAAYVGEFVGRTK